mmetsp:Transcript_9395/g.17833  ORF Transcript_9395/g.17833 Transcript_9395/m.17833 type:complete len:213 (+) Transcript_9395:4332-4970(+)
MLLQSSRTLPGVRLVKILPTQKGCVLAGHIIPSLRYLENPLVGKVLQCLSVYLLVLPCFMTPNSRIRSSGVTSQLDGVSEWLQCIKKQVDPPKLTRRLCDTSLAISALNAMRAIQLSAQNVLLVYFRPIEIIASSASLEDMPMLRVLPPAWRVPLHVLTLFLGVPPAKNVKLVRSQQTLVKSDAKSARPSFMLSALGVVFHVLIDVLSVLVV